jgi:hypothetical protein
VSDRRNEDKREGYTSLNPKKNVKRLREKKRRQNEKRNKRAGFSTNSWTKELKYA